MKVAPAAWGMILLAVAGQAFAHRLDEYLQATTIELAKDRIAVEIRLTPGVAVTPVVLAAIDRDADGVISEAEQRDYVEQVLRDVSLSLDGEAVPLHLSAKRFARVQDMQEGTGEILFRFSADVPHARAGGHTLHFENKHRTPIGVYLVNVLVPSDPDLHVNTQVRNFEQTSYRLDYSQAGGSYSGSLAFSSWSGQRVWLAALVLLMVARIALSRRQPA